MKSEIAAALLATVLCGCSVIRLNDPSTGQRVATIYNPAWPWQDTTKMLDGLKITSDENKTTAEVRGLKESTSGATNLPAIVGAAMEGIVRGAK